MNDAIFSLGLPLLACSLFIMVWSAWQAVITMDCEERPRLLKISWTMRYPLAIGVMLFLTNTSMQIDYFNEVLPLLPHVDWVTWLTVLIMLAVGPVAATMIMWSPVTKILFDLAVDMAMLHREYPRKRRKRFISPEKTVEE